MTNTAVDHPGIISWISTIRTTMANDPGRQLLEDQIRTDGFLFLEDYLENILTRPRHDPIIELVKTPARRKNASKKTRGATTASTLTKPIITMDLDELDSDKENGVPRVSAAPINAFHKALLQSKEPSASTPIHQKSEGATGVIGAAVSSGATLTTQEPEKPESGDSIEGYTSSAPVHALTDDEEKEQEEKVVEKLVTPPHLRFLPPQYHEDGPPAPVINAGLMEPLAQIPYSEPVAELSVIAEVDESAERSANLTVNSPDEEVVESRPTPSLVSSNSAKGPKPYVRRMSNIDMTTVMDIEDITQTVNFKATSTSAESHDTEHNSSTKGLPPVDTTENIPSLQSRPVGPNDVDVSTTPLIRDESPSMVTRMGEAPSMVTRMGEAPSAPKPTISNIPSIGPPSPLRKSTRVDKDPIPATRRAPSVIESTAARSSWLVKAKEAKAMEGGARKHATLSTFAHHAATGKKRKSGDMLASGRSDPSRDDEDRTQKLTRVTETSPVLSLLKSQERHPFGRFRDETVSLVDDEMHENMASTDGSDGMIDKLKKTVAGFSARAGKSMGKSLGGAAAVALAEARAAAEAKVAERNAAEGRVIPVPVSAFSQGLDESRAIVPSTLSVGSPEVANSRTGGKDRRLSVSDLTSTSDVESKETTQALYPDSEHSRPQQTATKNSNNVTTNASTSTTPPISPPKIYPPVFALPEKPKLVQTFVPPSNQVFSRVEPQPPATLQISQHDGCRSNFFTTQSTYSDVIFDQEVPAWVPSTQDTHFSDDGPTHSSLRVSIKHDMKETKRNMDADESWHLDDKFGETWTPVTFHMKDDSMPWSNAASQSTRSADTGSLDKVASPKLADTKNFGEGDTVFEAIPSDNPPCTATDEIDEEDMDVEPDEDYASVRLVTPVRQSKVNRSSVQEEAQASSTNVGGFLSSASRLVSNVLGGNKKGKEPVKSIQLAAGVAKKQLEEAEKKANRLKEMEARRQLISQKKAEQDKALKEKKAKDEDERWKRDREKEDLTESRTAKQTGKKIEDDVSKKRKLGETEKTDLKKPPSKDKKDAPATKIGKVNPTSAQSGTNAFASSSKPLKQTASAVVQGSASKVTTGNNDGRSLQHTTKGKTKMKDNGATSKQPSQLTYSQMQARYHAQVEGSQATQMKPPPVPTESIELPDINSEYSDSDDETRARTLPDWAQSPELRVALESQKNVNPDDIFGAIRPLKMEELFKNRTSRFRSRTSSANWAGPDGLTMDEELEYARRMGYKQ